MNLAYPNTSAMMADIEALYECGERRPGSRAGAMAERYIAARFREAGLQDVTLEPFAIQHWDAKGASLVLHGDAREEVPCFYIATSHFTKEDGISAQTVYVGADESLSDCKIAEKIVVFDHPGQFFSQAALFQYEIGAFSEVDQGPQPWNRLNFEAIARDCEARGAAGLIGLLSQMPYDTDRYYAPYDGYHWPFPGVWVRPSLAGRVRDHAKNGQIATLGVHGRNVTSSSFNILGFLPGKSDEIIMVASHHDSPFRSAVEDASGMAVVLAMADTFGRLGPYQLDKTLLFVSCAAHFGEKGSYHFAKDHYDDLLPRVAANIHIEHIGIECAGRGGELIPTGRRQLRVMFTSDEDSRLVEAARDAIVSEDLDRTMVIPASNPVTGPIFPADGSPIFAVGVPTINYISGPIYLLNGEDTLDKIDRTQLEPVMRAMSRIVLALDPVSLADIQRPKALLERDFEPADNPLAAIQAEFVEQQLQQAASRT